MAASVDRNDLNTPIKPLPHQISTYDLFKDESMKAAFKSLPKEEQERYKREGEKVYSVDYDTLGVGGTDTKQKAIEDAAYIAEGLKSGLLPRQLEKEEIETMRQVFGKKWYERYGYTSEND
jgi:hypothetical protein